MDTEHEYLLELVVSINRVFSEVHLCSTHSFELYIRPIDTVLEVCEVAFEPIDMRFEIFDAHQGETKERLIPFRHQRKVTIRCWQVV